MGIDKSRLQFRNNLEKQGNPGMDHLSFLSGKKIVRVGLLDFQRIWFEGGFAIDYEDGKNVKRVIFGFNELGMWVDWKGEVKNGS